MLKIVNDFLVPSVNNTLAQVAGEFPGDPPLKRSEIRMRQTKNDQYLRIKITYDNLSGRQKENVYENLWYFDRADDMSFSLEELKDTEGI